MHRDSLEGFGFLDPIINKYEKYRGLGLQYFPPKLTCKMQDQFKENKKRKAN